MAKTEKKIGIGKGKGRHGDSFKGQRDEKGRFVSPVNGQPVPKGRPFTAGDPRAKECQEKSTIAQKEKGDLRKLCQLWMETEVATDKDGKPITGGQMMVRVAVKELAKGNPRFWELMRDTAGYKPIDKVMVSEVEQSVIDEVEGLVKGAGDESEEVAEHEDTKSGGGQEVQERPGGDG